MKRLKAIDITAGVPEYLVGNRTVVLFYPNEIITFDAIDDGPVVRTGYSQKFPMESIIEEMKGGSIGEDMFSEISGKAYSRCSCQDCRCGKYL
jgi:hypothetical protein